MTRDLRTIKNRIERFYFCIYSNLKLLNKKYYFLPFLRYTSQDNFFEYEAYIIYNARTKKGNIIFMNLEKNYYCYEIFLRGGRVGYAFSLKKSQEMGKKSCCR